MNNIGEQIEFLNHLEQNPYQLYKVTFYDPAVKANMTYIGFKGDEAKSQEYEGKRIMMTHVSNPDDPDFLKRRVCEMKDNYIAHTMTDGKLIDWDTIKPYDKS